MILLALPGTAGAATASVVPYQEPPDTDPFGSCGRYMMCPPDMLAFTAAAGEFNELTITLEVAGNPRSRYLLRDASAPVQAGAGCEQRDANAAACTAAVIGPVQVRDGDDLLVARAGWLSGGEGEDSLNSQLGVMDGDGGDDLLMGQGGDGGPGDDLLIVNSGLGGSGDDTLLCFRVDSACFLDGGRGRDQLTGGTAPDRLFGRQGGDVLRGLAKSDKLSGGRGDDRLNGGRGADRVDCGLGRRDRAVADRRDDVKRCERTVRGPA